MLSRAHYVLTYVHIAEKTTQTTQVVVEVEEEGEAGTIVSREGVVEVEDRVMTIIMGVVGIIITVIIIKIITVIIIMVIKTMAIKTIIITTIITIIVETKDLCLNRI